jgi:outer membrane protein OmpA-like peptidoglycan-associated protein
MSRTFTLYIFHTKKSVLFSLFALISFFSRAQNLVADSSFEHNSGIPTLLSSIGMSTSWFSPTRATTDLFCECGKKEKEISEAQVPYNPMGVQKANRGKCYAGIYGFSHGDYREYLMTQLTSPLSPGVKYDFSMWISLSDYSRTSIDQIGVCFLSNKINIDNSDVITGVKPAYLKIENEIRTDTVWWHQLTLEYKANGGEQYLLIGSFDVNEIEHTNARPPKGVRTRINQKTDRDAYYYIDDVSLRQYIKPYVARIDTIVVAKVDTLPAPIVATNTVEQSSQQPAEIVLDKPIVLKNVLFETNEAMLLQSSFSELDATVSHLMQNPGLKIEVSGHTDNKGNEIQNVKLSEARAKAVADYLISKKVDPVRITYKGHGSQKPVAENTTEEGRKQNRRVELLFSK